VTGGNHDTVYVTSRARAAWLFGVDAATWTKWLHRGMPPRTPHGWDIRAVIAWRLGGCPNPGAEDGETTEEAKRRLAIAKANLAEQASRERGGELVEAAEARAREAELMRWAVSIFERAGSELASKLAGKSPSAARKVVDDYFRRVREKAVRR